MLQGAGEDTMESEELSVIAWCWPDPQTNTAQLRVVNGATGEEVRLMPGSFLLRISIDEKASVTRCHVRHIVSSREVYMQSGPRLHAFVEDCLLNGGESPPTATDIPNE